MRTLIIRSLWKNAQKPDFLNLSKIGKPYSIHLGIFVLTVLKYNLSEKNIFIRFLTPVKNDLSILSDNPS